MHICVPRPAVCSCFYSLTAGLPLRRSPESEGTRRLPCCSGFYTLCISLRLSPNVTNNLQLPFRLYGGPQISAERKESPGNPGFETALLAYETSNAEQPATTAQSGLDRGNRVVHRAPLNLAGEFVYLWMHIPVQWPEQGH